METPLNITELAELAEITDTPQPTPDKPKTNEVKRPRRAGFTKNRNRKRNKARRLLTRHSRRINRGR